MRLQNTLIGKSSNYSNRAINAIEVLLVYLTVIETIQQGTKVDIFICHNDTE